MNRRQLLAAAPAVMVAGAMPAVAEKPSRILELYHRRCKLVEEGCASPVTDEDELDRLFWNEIDAIDDEINATPCLSAADFAAKAIIATTQGDNCPDWERDPLWIEARALVAA